MRRHLLSLLLAPGLAVSALAANPGSSATPSASPSASETPSLIDQSESAISAAARSKALELAGAFANDGYKTRDGFWFSQIELQKPKFIQVNLFAGNEYWFSVAALPPASKISVSVYDEKGKLLPGEVYGDGIEAAAGVEAVYSGRYYIKVQLLEGDKSNFCLVYSYK